MAGGNFLKQSMSQSVLLSRAGILGRLKLHAGLTKTSFKCKLHRLTRTGR